MIRIQKVLVPIDFSENSQKAVKYGLSLAKLHNAKVYVLNVISQRIVDAIHELSVKGYKGDFVEIMKDVIQDREKEMRGLVPDHWAEGVEREFLVKQGKPGKVIVDLARELEADLIVVGHQGRSAIGDFLLGSVAQYVVNRAPCPVLVIHPIEREIVS